MQHWKAGSSPGIRLRLYSIISYMLVLMLSRVWQKFTWFHEISRDSWKLWITIIWSYTLRCSLLKWWSLFFPVPGIPPLTPPSPPLLPPLSLATDESSPPACDTVWPRLSLTPLGHRSSCPSMLGRTSEPRHKYGTCVQNLMVTNDNACKPIFISCDFRAILPIVPAIRVVVSYY